MDLTIAFETAKNEIILKQFIENKDPKDYLVNLSNVNELVEAQVTDNSERIDEQSQNLLNIKKMQQINLIIAGNDYSDLIPETTYLVSHEESNVSLDYLRKMNYKLAEDFYKKSVTNSLIKSNLQLISRLSSESFRLSKIFLENREVFILHLWRTIYHNLGCVKLSLFFQSIESDDSKKLILRKLDNPTLDSIQNCNEDEIFLLDNFNDQFGSPFNIATYDSERKKIAISSTLQSCKIMVMASIIEFSALQRSTIQGLFNSIHFFLQNKK